MVFHNHLPKFFQIRINNLYTILIHYTSNSKCHHYVLFVFLKIDVIFKITIKSKSIVIYDKSNGYFKSNINFGGHEMTCSITHIKLTCPKYDTHISLLNLIFFYKKKSLTRLKKKKKNLIHLQHVNKLHYSKN
jgi:hypothetical protein